MGIQGGEPIKRTLKNRFACFMAVNKRDRNPSEGGGRQRYEAKLMANQRGPFAGKGTFHQSRERGPTEGRRDVTNCYR